MIESRPTRPGTHGTSSAVAAECRRSFPRSFPARVGPHQNSLDAGKRMGCGASRGDAGSQLVQEGTDQSTGVVIQNFEADVDASEITPVTQTTSEKVDAKVTKADHVLEYTGVCIGVGKRIFQIGSCLPLVGNIFSAAKDILDDKMPTRLCWTTP
eukprot:SAG11_NODE_1361_length_5112_cov_2.921404_1_plen_155_part_00